jgi:predicted PurR-regulated permease PerM
MQNPELKEAQSETAPTHPGEWSQFTRQAAIVILLLSILVLISILRPLLNLLGITGIFILVLSYPVNSLRKRIRMPYAAAVVTVFIPVAILLFFVFRALLQWFVADAEALVATMQGQTGSAPLTDLIVELFPASASAVVPALQSVREYLGGQLAVIAQLIGLTATSFFLAFLFVLEMPANLTRSFHSMSDVSQHEFGILFDRLSDVWNGWLRSTVISSIIVGATTALELYIFGIPYAGVLGVITGLLNLIPTFGPLISYLLIIIVTFTQGSTHLSLSPTALTILVWGVNLIVNQVIRLVIFPRLASKALHLPVFLVILGLLVAAVLWGVVGVILVIPLLGSASEMLHYVLRKINRQEPYPGQQPHPGFWVQEIASK